MHIEGELTHNIASNPTEEVNEPHPKPANGPLNLDPHVQLDHHDDKNVDDTQVDEDGQDPAPELVSSWQQWIAIRLSDVLPIEAADVSQTVHLLATVQLLMEESSSGGTLFKMHHLAVTSDGDAAGVEGARRTKPRVVGRAGYAGLKIRVIPGRHVATCDTIVKVCGADVLSICTASQWRLVPQHGIPTSNPKIGPHAGGKLSSNLNHVQGGGANPEVNRAEVGHFFGPIDFANQGSKVLHVRHWS